jgi:hypothetical protein
MCGVKLGLFPWSRQQVQKESRIPDEGGGPVFWSFFLWLDE